MLVLKSR